MNTFIAASVTGEVFATSPSSGQLTAIIYKPVTGERQVFKRPGDPITMLAEEDQVLSEAVHRWVTALQKMHHLTRTVYYKEAGTVKQCCYATLLRKKCRKAWTAAGEVSIYFRNESLLYRWQTEEMGRDSYAKDIKLVNIFQSSIESEVALLETWEEDLNVEVFNSHPDEPI